MNSTNSLALILISVGMSFLFTKPMYASLSAALAEKDGYEDTLEKVRSINELQKTLSNQLSKLSAEEKGKVATLLPDSADITKFVADVDAVASRHGISIEAVSYTETNKDASASVSEGVVPEEFSSMSVDLSFAADYADMKSFVSDLEKSLRIIDIRSISSDAGKAGIYKYKVTAEIYWLK